MEYTAIGNNVNLAARLESANKYYGTAVLLAQTTVDGLKSSAVLRQLDLIQAKGISQPTWVYESLGHHTAATFPKLAPVIKAYEAGVDCYQRRDWTGGLAHFAAALEMAPRIGRHASSSTAAATFTPAHRTRGGTGSGSCRRNSAGSPSPRLRRVRGEG